MTKKELINYLKLNNRCKIENELEFNLDVNYFGKQIPFLVSNISDIESEPEITILHEIITDIQKFNPNSINWFKDKIWNHFKIKMENGWFGMVNYNGFDNEKDANFAHFNIYSNEDAYKALKLGVVDIYVFKKGMRAFNLGFSCPWELEHGITVNVANHQFDGIE